MPELPDVETYKKYIDSTSINKKIKKAEVKNKKIVERINAEKLEKKLKNKALKKTHRHGKNLFIKFDENSWLLLHFGMTGDIKYFKDLSNQPEHTRLLLKFENDYKLAFDNQRKLGKIAFIEDIDKYIKEKNLGEDALNISFNRFKELMSKKRGAIKSALMDQKTIAGVGNIYADEILFQTGIYPKTSVNKIDEKSIKKIYDNMKKVLKKAIEKNANPDDFPKNFIIPHRNKSDKCPLGEEKLETVKVSGRTSYYCPKHQKKK